MRMTDDKRQLLEARVYKKILAKSARPTPPQNGHIVFENVSNIIISCALGTGKLRGEDLKDSNSYLAACMQNNCWQPPDLDTHGIFAGRAKVTRVYLPCNYQPKVQKSWAAFFKTFHKSVFNSAIFPHVSKLFLQVLMIRLWCICIFICPWMSFKNGCLKMCLCWHLFQDDMPDLNKRLLSIECQLKKSELSRKHLEVTNKKLLVFAQVWILMSQYISALNMET